MGRASALLAESPPGRAPTFAEVWPVRQRVWRTYQELREGDAPRAARLAGDLSRYEQALSARGLTPEDALLAGGGAVPATRSLPGLAAAAPLALAGAVLNVVPYRVIDWIARHTTRTPDQPATYKVLGALIFLPLGPDERRSPFVEVDVGDARPPTLPVERVREPAAMPPGGGSRRSHVS